MFGRNDARDEYVAFAHDDRGVDRVFDMTFGDGEWTLLRKDLDYIFERRAMGDPSPM